MEGLSVLLFLILLITKMCIVRKDKEVEDDMQRRENVVWLRQLERDAERLRRMLAERQRREREIQERLQRERDEETRRIRSLRDALSRLNEGRDREPL